jgi:hypothetical protein
MVVVPIMSLPVPRSDQRSANVVKAFSKKCLVSPSLIGRAAKKWSSEASPRQPL